jgi:hypothetical protein
MLKFQKEYLTQTIIMLFENISCYKGETENLTIASTYNVVEIMNILKDVDDVKVFTLKPFGETIKQKIFCIELTFNMIFMTHDKCYTLLIVHESNPKTLVEKYKICFDELTKEKYVNIPVEMTESYYFEQIISCDKKLLLLNDIPIFDKTEMIDDIDIEDYFCGILESMIDKNIFNGDKQQFTYDDDIVYLNVSLKTINFNDLIEILTDETKIKSCKRLYKFSGRDRDEEREYLLEIDHSYIYIVYCDDDCTCAGHHVRYYFTEYLTLEDFGNLETAANKSFHDKYVEKYVPEILMKNYYYLLDMYFPRY